MIDPALPLPLQLVDDGIQTGDLAQVYADLLLPVATFRPGPPPTPLKFLSRRGHMAEGGADHVAPHEVALLPPHGVAMLPPRGGNVATSYFKNLSVGAVFVANRRWQCCHFARL